MNRLIDRNSIGFDVAWLHGRCARYGFVAIAWAVAAYGQAQKAEPTFRATTQLVEVGVVAKDARGNAVADLRQSDFELYDEGKRQEIRLFAKHIIGPDAAGNAGPGVTAQADQGRRIFSNSDEGVIITSPVSVVLIDELNTPWADQAYARVELMKFLKQLRPGDRVGIYTMGFGGFRILHEFTRDSGELVRRLRAWSPQAQPKEAPGTAGGLMDPQTPVVDWLTRYLGPSILNSGAATPLISLSMHGMSPHRGMEDRRNYFNTSPVSIPLKVLAAVASHLAGFPGRKNLIWVTGGFGCGAECYNEMIAAMRVVNNAHVAIYAVDARGLVPYAPDASYQVPANAPVGYGPDQATMAASYWINGTQQTMLELADRSGGRALMNRNDIMEAIRSTYDDARVTYALGYYPSAAHQDGKYHKITLRVRGRKDVRLLYRKGYVDEPPPANDPGRREKELREALWSPADATGLAVTTEVHPLPDGRTCDVTVRVGIRGVTLDDAGERKAGRVDISIAQKNEQGEQFEVIEQGLGLQLTPQTYSQMLKNGLMYRRNIELNPKATTLRVVARDAGSANIGSITIPIKEIVGAPVP